MTNKKSIEQISAHIRSTENNLKKMDVPSFIRKAPTTPLHEEETEQEIKKSKKKNRKKQMKKKHNKNLSM